MQVPSNLFLLVDKYLDGTITTEELQLLNDWYRQFDDTKTEVFSEKMEDELELSTRIRNHILDTTSKPSLSTRNRKSYYWRKVVAAASVIILLGTTGLYFLFSNKTTEQINRKVAVKSIIVKDFAPGGNKATLTLSDGSAIILDSAGNGVLSQQGNMQVQKLSNGLLAYHPNETNLHGIQKLMFNTITTPRGGQYMVTLSDGTKVWLDAASSLHFPIAFTGNSREVELNGEAYFEVAKNKQMPFKVNARGSLVEVIGTHFNVNAYRDENAIKTTLLEGKVKVSSLIHPQEPKYLSPGEQSSINLQGNINITQHADIEQAIAWKEGHFQFNSTDLKSILRQLSRWYDADIIYEGKSNPLFTGQLSKSLNVSKVFETLSLTNEVHYTINGRKIIVSP